MSRLQLVDCTLREGDQTAGVAMSPDQKLAIARQLDCAGVALADAGMPELGEAERSFLRRAAATCERMVVGASVRCIPAAVELALRCGVGAVFVICPSSRLHLERRLGCRLGELLSRLEPIAAQTRAAGASLEVVAEDASRAEPEDLDALLEEAIAVGAARLYLADTVGCRTPAGVAALVARTVARAGGRIAVGVHCHNDLGMATANTVAAIEAGCRWPTACVNGLGERAGNAELGAVAVAAERLLGLDTGFDARALPALSAAVAAASGLPVPAGAPLVGRNAFRHESGIHVDGLLKDPATYEAIPPEAVGRTRSLVLGRHSGRAHLRALLASRQLTLTDEALEALLRWVHQEALEGAGAVPLERFWARVEEA